MDSSGIQTGSSEKNEDFQKEVTNGLNNLTSECLVSSSGSVVPPEYKGGGCEATEEGQIEIEDTVTIGFADGINIDFSRRNLAAESHFFRALFLSNFKDSQSKTITLPTITSTMFRSCLSLAYSSQVSPVPPEVPLQLAVDMMPIASYLCMDVLLDLLSHTIHSNVETASILPVYRQSTDRHPPLAARLWNTLIRKFKALVIDGEHLQLTEDEFLAAFKDEHLNIPSALEATVIKQYIQKYPEDTRVSTMADNLSFTGDGVDTYGVFRDRIPNEVVLSLGGWCSIGPSDVVETYNSRNKSWIASTIFGGIAAPYIGTLAVLSPSAPLILLMSLCFVAGILTLLLPETNKKPLPTELLSN